MSVVEAQKGMTDLIPCNEECGADMGTYSWSQNDDEVIVRVPVSEGTTGKLVDVKIATGSLSVGLKGKQPVLSGETYSSVKAEDSLWSLEERKVIVVTLTKANLKHEEWWPHVCKGERQIDMKTLKPPSKHIRDLDSGAQAQVQKMMFDQHQKRQGLPTSDEMKMQELMKSMPPPPTS